MGLSKHGYGIHGTNEPKSIGKAASHGCIRMARSDLEELYALVSEGDTVELIGQRNEETAQVFAPQLNQPAAADPLVALTGTTGLVPSSSGATADINSTSSDLAILIAAL